MIFSGAAASLSATRRTGWALQMLRDDGEWDRMLRVLAAEQQELGFGDMRRAVLLVPINHGLA